jgi:hypothetical protein
VRFSGFNFTPDGFDSGINGGSGLAQGTMMVGLSKSGSTYTSAMNLFYAVPGGDQIDGRELVLNVSSVTVIATPLPPALPMFASALLTLAIIGYVGRKRAATGQ